MNIVSSRPPLCPVRSGLALLTRHCTGPAEARHPGHERAHGGIAGRGEGRRAARSATSAVGQAQRHVNVNIHNKIVTATLPLPPINYCELSKNHLRGANSPRNVTTVFAIKYRTSYKIAGSAVRLEYVNVLSCEQTRSQDIRSLPVE